VAMDAQGHAAALADIVRACTFDDDPWGALAAQLSADTLVLAEILEENPDAVLNEDVIGAPEIAGESVVAVVRRYRDCLAASLGSPRLASQLESRFGVVNAAESPLLPENARDFAQSWHEGSAASEYRAFHEGRSAKLYALARGLHAEGDLEGFQRTVYAADTSTFLAHHSRESERVGDEFMALLRTGMLLAEYAMSSLAAAADAFEAVDATRDAFEWATLTEAKPRWGIVPDRATPRAQQPV